MSKKEEGVYGLRHQLGQYFERQAEHLLGNARAAASLTTHDGLFGLASESSVRTFLSEHLPARYGVSTGHIVSYRENSAQVDIVIFDAQECFKIPITESEMLFSIEGVYAAIEVKSSPARSSSSQSLIKQAVSNIVSVKSLDNPPFALMSQGPVFTRLTDLGIVNRRKNWQINPPVGAILIVGSRDSFETAASHFRREANSLNKESKQIPDLLCVLDERNFGLCGFDYHPTSDDHAHADNIRWLFWKESCESAGDTLAKFLYWLMHKMILEHFTEIPIIENASIQGIWPSVMAPVIKRVKVDVSDNGTQRSFPWNNDTRQFPK